MTDIQPKIWEMDVRRRMRWLRNGWNPIHHAPEPVESRCQPESNNTMKKIHPTAIVAKDAELGDGIEIGPYCVIESPVRIGDGTRLHNHVTIGEMTSIGRDCEIFPFSVIGAAPQDLKYRGENAVLEIGDRNTIREHVTIHRGTENGGGVTKIGDDNLLMVASHVAHDCHIGSECVIANQVMIGGHAIIEDHVSIGGGAGIHHYATIGTFAFISGLARIKKDVPPYMKIEGEPAEVRGVNTIALSRAHFDDSEINAVREAYKRLFMKHSGSNGNGGGETNGCESNGDSAGQPMSVILEELAAEFQQSVCVTRLCEFIQSSSNGVHGRSSERSRKDRKFAPRVETAVEVEPIRTP